MPVLMSDHIQINAYYWLSDSWLVKDDRFNNISYKVITSISTIICNDKLEVM
jgi:hypothetical protein